MRGEKKEKVRRRRRAPRDDLRERTEKVAKVVSHVNEMAEQKTDSTVRSVKTGHVLLSFHDVQRSPRARGTPTETQWPRATYTVRAALMASWHGKGLHKEGEREYGCPQLKADMLKE